MYKNQLQELAQRSCFNLPSYTCIREGPDHAPRFKAAVIFNGETFESLTYCSTLRQAEHSAAAVALNDLARRGPSNSLASRILDETGVYKNLLQEVSQRVGASLPAYATFRTGLGHLPVFTCTVDLAGVVFTGESAKNKKQAEKNAAMAAWLSLKSLLQGSVTPHEKIYKDEQEHAVVARAFHKYLIKARSAKLQFPIVFPALNPRPTSAQPSPATSKILPLICPAVQGQSAVAVSGRVPAIHTIMKATHTKGVGPFQNEGDLGLLDDLKPSLMAPASGSAPYIPAWQCRSFNRLAPPVTIRNAIPVFSAPPPPSSRPSLVIRPPPVGVAQSVSVFSAPCKEEVSKVHSDQRIHRPMTANLREPPTSKLLFFEGLKSSTVYSESSSQGSADQHELPLAEAPTVAVVSPAREVDGPLPCLNVRSEASKIVKEVRSIDIGGLED